MWWIIRLRASATCVFISHAGDPEQFFFLNQGSAPVVQSINDAEDFVSMRQALTVLGQLQWEMFLFVVVSPVFGNLFNLLTYYWTYTRPVWALL